MGLYTVKIKRGTGILCCDGCKAHHAFKFLGECICSCHVRNGKVYGHRLRIWLSDKVLSSYSRSDQGRDIVRERIVRKKPTKLKAVKVKSVPKGKRALDEHDDNGRELIDVFLEELVKQ